MLSISYSLTNSSLWGKNIQWVVNGQLVDNIDKADIPIEMDFIEKFFPLNPSGAKEYFKCLVEIVLK